LASKKNKKDKKKDTKKNKKGKRGKDDDEDGNGLSKRVGSIGNYGPSEIVARFEEQY
jgi:hypothetical protein